jgi:putative endonuclease
MIGYVCILECADGSYYVGSTTNMGARLWQHQQGPDGAAYTRRRRPVQLVWCVEFESVVAAFSFEKQVQGWATGQAGGADPRGLRPVARAGFAASG